MLIQKDGEWVLVSKKKPHRILRHYGKTKPTDEEVASDEARIHMFVALNKKKSFKQYKNLKESDNKEQNLLDLKTELEDMGLLVDLGSYKNESVLKVLITDEYYKSRIDLKNKIPNMGKILNKLGIFDLIDEYKCEINSKRRWIEYGDKTDIEITIVNNRFGW